MSDKTDSYNSLATDNSPSCEVWVMTRPDLEKLNVNLHLLICDLMEEGWVECNSERFNKVDELELIKAKAWDWDVENNKGCISEVDESVLDRYRDRDK